MKRKIYLYEGPFPDSRVDLITFPTGEKHIRIRQLQKGEDVVLMCKDSCVDLMLLGMAVDICDQADVGSITIFLPFVPYARQDEVYVHGDPLSIKVFANFLNSLDVDKVVIVDPHSKVTPALINNVEVIPQRALGLCAMLIAQIDSRKGPFAIVAPDLGATKKIKDLLSQFKHQYDDLVSVIQCDKTRDPKTGKITGFKVLDGDPTDCHCLIIDDICDGGGTFMGIHGALEDAGARSQSLFVTHGIFSKGVAGLKKKFVRIITSDSLPNTEGVTLLKIGDLDE